MKTLIRQTAMKWWRGMSMIDQSFITQKYSTLLYGRGASSLTSREIEMLYLKEHPILCKHCYSPKGVETGLCSSCGKFPTTAHLKEHPHIQWWNSKNYNTKKRLSEGYIHPTDSGVDPVMFLDDETIREIYLKEHPTEAETVNNNIKGALNGLCNRAACQKPGANYYNHYTREHYCKECAEMINSVNRTDAMRMYGHDLCTLVEQRTEVEVSKEEETHNLLLADSLSKYIYDKYTQEECVGFIDGFKAAQEKDRVLIEDLLEIVNVLSATINPDDYTREFKSKVRNSITKAEQRIKK